MSRFQFSLRDLFWLTFVIASIFGGSVFERQLDESSYRALLAAMLVITLLFALPSGWRRRRSNPAHLVAVCFLCCVFGAGLVVRFVPGYLP
jgi:predicted MFS family arabinose efflux permease